MNKTKSLNALKAITEYALPITAASLLNIISNFAAMLMVAHIGKTALAASTLAMSTYITIMTIVSTTLFAISILVSHAKGDTHSERSIGNIVTNGLWLACLMFVPSSFLLWHADKALILFRQDPILIDLIRPYFHYAALSLLPMLLSGVIAQFYTGIGQPRFAMTTSLIRLPFIVILSYGLILGRFGMPQMGLAGVMCATCIVQSIYTIGLFIYLHQNSAIKAYCLFDGLYTPNKRLLKKIFFLGIPIGLQFGGELAAMTSATYLVGLFGVSTLAASQIVSQFSMFVVMVILGLSQALSVLVSHAYAQRNMTLIKTHLFSALILYGIVFIFVLIVFLGLPNRLISFYIDLQDHQLYPLIQLTRYFFEVACVFLLFDAIRHILAGTLRGLHDSTAPMRIGIFCLWGVSLPMSYLLGFYFHEGPIGLRLGFISGFVLASTLLFKRLHKRISSETTLIPSVH